MKKLIAKAVYYTFFVLRWMLYAVLAGVLGYVLCRLVYELFFGEPEYQLVSIGFFLYLVIFYGVASTLLSLWAWAKRTLGK